MKIEATGKNIETAIQNGLKKLGITQEQAEIEILSEGGLLKKAKVAISKKQTQGEKALIFLEELLVKMNFTYVAELAEDTEEEIRINLIGADGGGIIGHRGETLDALQYLVSIVVNGDKKEYTRVVVDAENYRQKRSDALAKLALNLEKKVVRQGRYVKLEPMNPFERRVIHATLADSQNVVTESVGDEPNRYVVISLKSNPYKASRDKSAATPGRRESGRRDSDRRDSDRRDSSRNRNGSRRDRDFKPRERSQRYEEHYEQQPTKTVDVEQQPSDESSARKKLTFVYRSDKKKRRSIR